MVRRGQYKPSVLRCGSAYSLSYVEVTLIRCLKLDNQNSTSQPVSGTSIPFLTSVITTHMFSCTHRIFIGSKTVTIGKCANPGIENMLLQTVARIQDTTGGTLLPTTVRYIADAISACHAMNN